jgi:hypothetical protein
MREILDYEFFDVGRYFSVENSTIRIYLSMLNMIGLERGV